MTSLASASLWRFGISSGESMSAIRQQRQRRRPNSGYPDNVYRLVQVNPMINIDWDKVQTLVLEQRQCAAAWRESKILHFVVGKDAPLDVLRVLVKELTSDLNRWLMLDVGTGTPLGIACGLFSNGGVTRQQTQRSTAGYHEEVIRVLLQGLLDWKNNEARPSAYCVPFASIDFSTVSLPILQVLLEEYPQGLLQDDTYYRPPQGKGTARCCFLGEVLLGSKRYSSNRQSDGNDTGTEAIDVEDDDDYWSKVELVLRTAHNLQENDSSSEANMPFLRLHALLTALTSRATLVDSILLEVGERRLLPELRRRYPEEWRVSDVNGNFPLHILASVGPKLQAWLKVLLMKEHNDNTDAAASLETCNRDGRVPLHVLLDNTTSSWTPNTREALEEIDEVLDMLKQMVAKSPRSLVFRDPVTRLYPFQLAVKESSGFLSSHPVLECGDRPNDHFILSLNMSYELLRQGPQVLSYFEVDKSQMEQPSYKELCLVDLKMAQLERTYRMEKQELRRKRSALRAEEMKTLLQVD